VRRVHCGAVVRSEARGWPVEVNFKLQDGACKVKPDPEKDRAAEEVVERRIDFETALENKRKYPMQEFEALLRAVRRYIEMTQTDTMVHKSVATSVNGLREYLEVERKRVPGKVLFEADRLECQFFAGYDPSFEGDEPSGL
jgi:hypothetical protein